MSGITLWPVLSPIQEFSSAPMLEYDFYVFSSVPTANIAILRHHSITMDRTTITLILQKRTGTVGIRPYSRY